MSSITSGKTKLLMHTLITNCIVMCAPNIFAKCAGTKQAFYQTIVLQLTQNYHH